MGSENIILKSKREGVEMELDFNVSGNANEVFNTTMGIAVDGLLDKETVNDFINDREIEGETIQKLYRDILGQFVDYTHYCFDSSDMERISSESETFLTADGKTYTYKELSDTNKAIADSFNTIKENFLNNNLVDGFIEYSTENQGKIMKSIYKDVVDSFAAYTKESADLMKFGTICERITNSEHSKKSQSKNQKCER